MSLHHDPSLLEAFGDGPIIEAIRSCSNRYAQQTGERPTILYASITFGKLIFPKAEDDQLIDGGFIIHGHHLAFPIQLRHPATPAIVLARLPQWDDPQPLAFVKP